MTATIPRPAILGIAAVLSLAGEARAQPNPSGTPSHVWLDAEGQPLPFQGDPEIQEFLRSAPVVSRERIPIGVNRPQRLLLEKGGTRARAAFRTVDIEERDVRIGDRFYFDFRDSYRHECAAYELARWLGLDLVPPAVLRRADGRDGSLQIWVEDTLDEESAGFAPPDVRAWVAQVWDKDLFDNLILNVDRNAGNVLVGRQYHLWLIDHTRAFQPIPELLDTGRVARARREVWDRLKAMDDGDLRGVVGEFLDSRQTSALAKRRDLLIEHVQRLIAERGEDAVLY